MTKEAMSEKKDLPCNSCYYTTVFGPHVALLDGSGRSIPIQVKRKPDGTRPCESCEHASLRSEVIESHKNRKRRAVA